MIEHQLDEFGLRETVTHNQGAYNAIMADTIARHEGGELILYYTWTPYWVSGVLVPGEDVEWLEVPHTSLPDGREAETMFEGKNLGFEVNDIRVVASNDFLEENPAARSCSSSPRSTSTTSLPRTTRSATAKIPWRTSSGTSTSG